jgi:hypothetical protein
VVSVVSTGGVVSSGGVVSTGDDDGANPAGGCHSPL